MTRTKRHAALRRASALALGALALGTLRTAAQAQSFQVTLNTASLAGTAGNLDFQFNPGGTDSQDATLQIDDFTTTGTLAGTSTDMGGGTGTLPGTLTIANSNATNEVFQGITFGSTLSFLATFSGPAITQPLGTGADSGFAFSLFDAAGANTLLGTNSDGSVLDITVNPDGSQTVMPGSTALTVTAAPVPEASTTASLSLLLTLSAGGLALARRRRVRA